MKKIHKLDLILLVGLALIAIVSALIDIFYVVVFPVYSCASVELSRNVQSENTQNLR